MSNGSFGTGVNPSSFTEDIDNLFENEGEQGREGALQGGSDDLDWNTLVGGGLYKLNPAEPSLVAQECDEICFSSSISTACV
jgi:hypothetical protein